MSRLKGADLGITPGAMNTVGFGLPTTTGRVSGDGHFDQNTNRQYVLSGSPLAWTSTSGAINSVGAGVPGFSGRITGDHHYDSTGRQLYVLTGAAGGSQILDSFSRTVSGGLGSTEQGGIAYPTYSTASVDGSVGHTGGGSNRSIYVNSGVTVDLEFSIALPKNTLNMGLGVRAPSSGNVGGYQAYVISNAGQTSMQLALNRNGTQVATTSVFNGGATYNDGTLTTHSLSVVGGVVTYKAYGQTLTYTDASPVVATQSWVMWGNFVASNNDTTFDNLSITPIGTLAWTATTQPNGMNYRGSWGSAATYGANDVVLRNAQAYTALLAVPANQDPANPVTAPQTQYAMSGAAMQGSGSPTGGAYYTDYTTAGVTSVTQVNIGATSGGGLNGSNVTLTITQGGTTIATSNTVTTAAGYNLVTSFTFPSTVTLAAGTTYRFTLSNTNLQWGGSPGTVSGSGSATAWTLGSTSPAYLNWAIIGPPPTYWQALAPTVENVNIVAASGASQTIPDVTSYTMHRYILTANTAFTLPPPGQGKSFTVELVQDATGGRVPTWATPSGAITWPGGTAPTITATANAVDVISFSCIGGTNWRGFVAGQAFA